MSGKLAGRKALVTGGARGIGAAVAHRLAADGADVAINYRSSSDAAQALADEITADGRRAVAIKADVSDPGQIQRLTDEAADALGGLDILGG
ncbi:SDR family NAD(P)-dependent oxidoreductase [Streptomyces aureus]|uniref:SDR family NAD(P)-dependent oxidoreductase n=1 Tax=Streptomyces aureus TaxID=193461 RepID=A0ABV4SPW7_9ACTN